MLLGSTEVTQAIDGDASARFVKELLYVNGPQPLAIVRKRLPPEQAPRGGYLAPLLLTHGFGQNRYAWHLSTRSFVNYLAREGFDVFNVDLRGHGRSRRLGSRPASSIDDYIQHDLPAALAEVLAVSGRPRAFVLGHSLGGLIACSAAPRLRDQIAGIVTIGTPYRFAQGSWSLATASRMVGLMAERGWIRATSGALPIKLLARWMHLYRAAWDSRLLPIPVRAWAPGAFEPRMLSEYLQRSFDSATIGTLVQLMRLANHGSLTSIDEREDYSAAFEACGVPLLVVAGAYDLLAPPPSVRPLYERAGGHDKAYRVLPFGHADMLLGKDAPRSTWPLVSGWLSARAALAREEPAAPAAAG